MGVRQNETGAVMDVTRALEIEREKLACVIGVHGIQSEEAYLQSRILDKLVVRYMKNRSNRILADSR